MARLVLALLVLVCLVAVCSCTYEADLRRQLRTHECRRLIKVLSKCGYKKRWTTQLQKDLAATMAQRPFHDDLNSCLSMSLDMAGNMSYCKHEPSLRIYLQCSRMSLFKRVDVRNKFAAIKFHGGFDHCVKVHMGMMDEFGELPMDDDDDDDDDDDEDDDGKVESGGKDDRQDKPKSSLMHADGGKTRRRRKAPMSEMDEMNSGHSHRKPATKHTSPGGGSGRGPDDVIQRRPYDKMNRHHGQPYDDDETMMPATEDAYHGQGGGRGPDDVIRRRPYDRINRHHGRPYDDDETMPRHRRQPRDDDDYMPSDVEPRKSDRQQYPDYYTDNYD